MNDKVRGLFLNSPAAQCSIHESGIMVYNVIKNVPFIEWDYKNLSEKLLDESQSIQEKYSFVLFNYHPSTAPWLCIDSIKTIKCLKINIVLETLPDDIYALCPRNVFDVHMAIDPTINDSGKKIYGMPRPISNASAPKVEKYSESSIIRIGTFGFATPGKGFERVVDAVNREFQQAEIRINIPCAEFADFATEKLHKTKYATYLIDNMKMIAKPGVQIIATDDFMTQDELVKWCQKNDINIFLYERDQPGLSATTDQAIASGKPLLVSDNSTFRHIHQFLRPYPFWTIKKTLTDSIPAMQKMQLAWNEEEFNKKFKKILEDNKEQIQKKYDIVLKRKKTENKIKKRKLRKLISLLQKARVVYQNFESIVRPTVKIKRSQVQLLMVNSRLKQCGVYQYGNNIFSEITKINNLSSKIVDVANQYEYQKAVSQYKPEAVLFNYYPFTMPWLSKKNVQGSNAKKLGVLHEMNEQIVSELNNEFFDMHIVPDPTLNSNRKDVFQAPRLVKNFCNYFPEPEIPTFGSFGFGFGNKGFEKIIDLVQDEYDDAVIKFMMPFNEVVEKNGNFARKMADQCKARVRKKGIKLIINHNFLNEKDLINSLAKNTANIFLYDETLDKGISSVLEYAIASRRPLIINKCPMFRHVYASEERVLINNKSIKSILRERSTPIIPFLNSWSTANFQMAWESFLFKLLKSQA